MDEPFGAVDPIVRARLQDELLDLQNKVSKTIVLVTHDVDEALRVADRIALMNVGGVIEQLATPDELMRAPANDFVESFVGEDRGLRRLALNTVSALRFHQGPVVDVDGHARRGRRAAEPRAATGWGHGRRPIRRVDQGDDVAAARANGHDRSPTSSGSIRSRRSSRPARCAPRWS
jgi:osmoprotectant transport system ATP-binding protein